MFARNLRFVRYPSRLGTGLTGAAGFADVFLQFAYLQIGTWGALILQII